MVIQNEGFNPLKIQEFRDKLRITNRNYILNDTEDNSDEYVNFFFIGKYQGKEVIMDAVIYTLRLHHSSEVFEIAEHEAAKQFPNYKKISYEEDENGDLAVLDSEEEEIGLFMAEIIMELEEEDSVKVKEHVEIDPNIDFGIGLDVGLNVETVNDKVIEKFIADYNDGKLQLDRTLYSFQTEENEEFS